ncbi:hypothetical protein ACHAWF_009780 [Thalassiosira exigua]
MYAYGKASGSLGGFAPNEDKLNPPREPSCRQSSFHLAAGVFFGQKGASKGYVSLVDRAKLNNAVVLGGATVGSNTILQNSVVSVGAIVGANCN